MMRISWATSLISPLVINLMIVQYVYINFFEKPPKPDHAHKPILQSFHPCMILYTACILYIVNWILDTVCYDV